MRSRPNLCAVFDARLTPTARRSQCLYRTTRCARCNTSVFLKDQTAPLDLVCPALIVECSRDRCSSGGAMRRDQFAAHEEVCSMERCVPPPFDLYHSDVES